MRLFALTALAGLFISTASFANQFDAPLFVSPFSLEWMNHDEPGTMYNSEDREGSVFVVEAYFLNCPYCNDNAPNINALQDEFADNEMVQILDVSRDCRTSDYRRWEDRHSPNHPVLNDCDQQLLGQLGVRGYPTTYILDCNMNVVYRHVGSFGSAVYREIVREVNDAVEGCMKK